VKEPSTPISRLRTVIRELASAGHNHRRHQQELRRTPGTGPVRQALREDYLITTRAQARHALLAYAMIRGRKYADIEPRSNEAPSERWLMANLLKAEPEVTPTPADLKAWIAGEECPFQVNLNDRWETRRALRKAAALKASPVLEATG